MRRVRVVVGWSGIAALLAISVVPFILSGVHLRLQHSEGLLPWLGAGTGLVVLGALWLRGLRGPPTRPAPLLVTASLPVLALAVARLGYRVEVGWMPEPDVLFEYDRALQHAIASDRWAVAASVALVVTCLAATAIVLDWARWTKVRVGRLSAGLVIVVGTLGSLSASRTFRELVAIAGFGLNAGVEAFLASSDGVRVSVSCSSLVCGLAVLLLVLGRTRDPRRMALATAFSTLSVCVAAYPEAILNQFPGFFCHREPPGPASWAASVVASHRATLAGGALLAVFPLTLGAALSWKSRRTATTPPFMGAAVVTLVAAQAIAPVGCLMASWSDASAERLRPSKPSFFATEHGVRLPILSDRPSWWEWRADHRWVPLVADASGVRSPRGHLSWHAMRHDGGVARLHKLLLLRKDDSGRWWRDDPVGVRLFADAALPMSRLLDFVLAARLDGFAVAVDTPSQPFYEGLAIPDREVRRAIVWVGSPPTSSGGGSRRLLSAEDVSDIDWLSPGEILVDRPPAGSTVGDWLLAMQRAVTAHDAHLVMLDPK